MKSVRTLVVTIDGFGAAAAGAYGQTSLATPGWDALATSAATFDFVDAPAGSREAILEAFLRGDGDATSVAEALRGLTERGARLTLAGDLEDLAASGPPAEFAERFDARTPFDFTFPKAPARREEETLAMRWLERAEEVCQATIETKRSALLWLHHRGGYGAWDAPLAWREALRDEEDPPPYAGVDPPRESASAAHDPDRFLSYVFAWGGQAAAWDRLGEGLHLLWKRLDAERPTTLIVLGLRGYPLGEHGVVGDGGESDRETPLHAERLHVPFFVLPPGGVFPGRHAQSVRRGDALLACLLASEGDDLTKLLDEETSGEIDPTAHALVVEGESVSLRTSTWRYTRDASGARLFLKPDDRWEANDVASRRRETIEALDRWLDERATQASPPPLPPEATTG